MKPDRVIAVRNTKTVYRDGSRCVKVFDENFSKADVLHEALNQARVEETGLNLPRILEVTRIDGKWAIVSEYIKGKTLSQRMEENPEKKEQYLEQLVDLQISVHQKTCPHLGRLKDKINGRLCLAALDAATRRHLQARLEEMPEHNKICHGDFDPSNVILAEDGTPYLLDWAHATQGNASADVARTYLRFRLNGDLSGAKKYLDLFCAKSNTAKAYVQKWMPIVAAAQSVTGNERERKFLLSFVDVADYE